MLMRFLSFTFAALFPLLAASAQPGFPFTDESLRYNLSWQSGTSLGEATLTAHRSAVGWNLDVTLNASVPGFSLAPPTCAEACTSAASPSRRPRLSLGTPNGMTTTRGLDIDGGRTLAPARRAASAQPIGRPDERAQIAWLARGMARVRRHAEVGLGPGPVERPRRLHGADDIVAALHDHRRHVPYRRHVPEQVPRRVEPRAVHEVVALDTREGHGEVVARGLLDQRGVREEAARRALPDAPRLGRLQAHVAVVARESSVERAHQIASLFDRDRLDVFLPRVGEECVGAALVEPRDLLGPNEEDPAEDQRRDAVRMRLGVREGEGAAPRAAEDVPSVDVQPNAQRLDVGYEVPGGVVDERRVRRALAAPALVEQDDPVRGGIEGPDR